MLYSPLRKFIAHNFRAETRARMIVTVLCIASVSSMFAACGSPTTAVQSTSSPVSTHVATPTPTQIPTPTPSPTPKPTATPVPVQASPAVLDLQPASMSIVGHLDCNKNGAFICFARVLSRTSNQSNLNWVAFTNVPGHIVFSPSGGVLAPGQSVLVTITVPFNACTTGLFFFQGPINTHTITWAC
jgi:hypothetical protein